MADENWNRHIRVAKKYMDELIPHRTLTNIRRTVLRELLQTRFDCPTVFEEMDIILQHVINSHYDNLQSISKIVNEVEAISTQSVEGNVLSGGFRHVDKMFIIKYNKPDVDKFDLLHEFIVGKALNPLRSIIPTFMYVYTYFNCDAEPNLKMGERPILCSSGTTARHLFIEYVEGVPLKKLLSSGELNPLSLWKIYLIIFASLAMAYESCKFTHNDLHSDNVMVRIMKRPVTVTFRIGSKTLHVNTEYVPTIIDYGFSRVVINGEIYHRDKTFDIGRRTDAIINPYPIIDFYKLISHSLYVLADNMQIRPFVSVFQKLINEKMTFISPGDIRTLQATINRGTHPGNFYYPTDIQHNVGYLQFVELFAEVADSRPISKPPTYDPISIRRQIYGLDKDGKIAHYPCNKEIMPGKDINGFQRSLYDCAKYYFDGTYNVVEIPAGTSIYHGSAALAFFNAKDPYGLEYYNRSGPRLLTSSEKEDLQAGRNVDKILTAKQPISLSFYGDLDIARVYSAEGKVDSDGETYRCGRNCTNSYITTKPVQLVDMTDPYNIITIARSFPPAQLFLMALFYGQTFTIRGQFLNPSNSDMINDIVNIMEGRITVPDKDTILSTITSGIRAWESRFGDLVTSPTPDTVEKYVKFNRTNPIRRFAAVDLERYSMRYNNYMIPNLLMDRFEREGYHGYAYLPTPYRSGQGFRFGELVLRNAAPKVIKRDLSNPNDWQYIDDRYIFGALGKLIRDMKKYKTTNIDFHAGDLIEHSVWTALYMQMMWRDNHPAVSGITKSWRNFLIAAAFLHDIGKGGNSVFVYYDKPEHPRIGAGMISERRYDTGNEVINLNDVFQEMGIGEDMIPILTFLVRFHWDIGSIIRECKTIDDACATRLYQSFNNMCIELKISTYKHLRLNLFASLYALWSADLMATQPYIARDKMMNLTNKIAMNPDAAGGYINEVLDSLPNISNLPKVHGGRNMYALYQIDQRGLPLRKMVLHKIDQS